LKIDEREKEKDDWRKKMIGREGRKKFFFFSFGMVDGQVCSNS